MKIKGQRTREGRRGPKKDRDFSMTHSLIHTLLVRARMHSKRKHLVSTYCARPCVSPALWASVLVWVAFSVPGAGLRASQTFAHLIFISGVG